VKAVFVGESLWVTVSIPTVSQLDTAKIAYDHLHHELKTASLYAVTDFLLDLNDPFTHLLQQCCSAENDTPTDMPAFG